MKRICRNGARAGFSKGYKNPDLLIHDNLRRGCLGRIWIYLKEMYPLRHFAMGILFFVSAWCGIDMVSNPLNGACIQASGVLLTGALTVALMLLLLRIMDELKDLDADLEHFPHRPVPRGDVRPSDLRLLGLLVVATLLFLNLFFTNGSALFMVLLGYAFLMYKFFFLRSCISKNILLALVSHNPFSYLIFLYVVDLYRNHVAPEMPLGQALLLGVVFLSFSLSWEVARKIRHPEQESAYQTYSMVLGVGRALLIPVGMCGVSLVVLFSLFGKIFSPVSFGFMLAAFLFLVLTYLRFFKRQHWTLGLRPATELFILTVQSLLVIEGLVKI
jgi:4-hydroxybenzoate polyprenyltransferase